MKLKDAASQRKLFRNKAGASRVHFNLYKVKMGRDRKWRGRVKGRDMQQRAHDAGFEPRPTSARPIASAH